MHKMVREYEQAQLRNDISEFKPGDTVRVSVRIREGDKSRLQDFQGVCIARDGSGMSETFTIRRVSYGVGMERVFPLQSPRVEKIVLVRQGRVRRAKLYYLRNLRGKKARIQEMRRPSLKAALVTKPLIEEPVEVMEQPEPQEAAVEQSAPPEAAAEPKAEE